MLWESQWVERRREDLPLLGLPPHLEGLRILHISDVHAGQPGLNLRSLRKTVGWAVREQPDIVFLTGDILGGRYGSKRGLRLLGRLDPPLGMFAVAGNHEYGLSKNPFAPRARPFRWEKAGVRLLKDECALVNRNGHRIAVCGADYVTGGHGLHPPADADFPILLIHRPPEPEDALGRRFPLAFAGHTHGGQIRIPSPWGLVAPHRDGLPYLEGVHAWGSGRLVLSRGIGTTFLPFRLFTRPEAVIYRLVPDHADSGRSGLTAPPP